MANVFSTAFVELKNPGAVSQDTSPLKNGFTTSKGVHGRGVRIPE